MCALPASIYPHEKLIHVHTHTVTWAKRDSFTAGHLSWTRTGGRQELGTWTTQLTPSAPQPSFVLLTGQQTPLSALPRGCGCWCEGDVPCWGSPCHQEGFHGQLLPCSHDCPSPGIWHPRGPCTKHCVRAPPLSLAANHPEQLTFRISVYFISTQNASISPLRKWATVPAGNFTSAISIKVLNASSAN